MSLDDPWKVSYKRQMDMYVWILSKKGFDVSTTSYFVYVDAQHKNVGGMLTDRADPSKAWMPFDASIISYEADVSWVEPTLIEIKDFLLHQKECPAHTPIGDGYSGCDMVGIERKSGYEDQYHTIAEVHLLRCSVRGLSFRFFFSDALNRARKCVFDVQSRYRRSKSSLLIGESDDRE